MSGYWSNHAFSAGLWFAHAGDRIGHCPVCGRPFDRPVIVRSPTGLRYVHFDVDRVDPYTLSEGLSWEKIFEADVRAVDPPSYLDFQAAWELEAGTAPSINTDPYSVDLATINWKVRYEFGVGIFSSNRHAIISGCAPYAMDFDYDLPPAFPLPSMIKASGRW